MKGAGGYINPKPDAKIFARYAVEHMAHRDRQTRPRDGVREQI